MPFEIARLQKTLLLCHQSPHQIYFDTSTHAYLYEIKDNRKTEWSLGDIQCTWLVIVLDCSVTLLQTAFLHHSLLAGASLERCLHADDFFLWQCLRF